MSTYSRTYQLPKTAEQGRPITMAMRIIYRGSKAVARFPAMRNRIVPPKEVRDTITRDFGMLGLSPAKAVQTFVGSEDGVVEMYWETKSSSQLVGMQRLAMDKLRTEKAADIFACHIDRIYLYYLPPIAAEEAKIDPQRDAPCSIIDHRDLSNALSRPDGRAEPSSSTSPTVERKFVSPADAVPHHALPTRPASSSTHREGPPRGENPPPEEKRSEFRRPHGSAVQKRPRSDSTESLPSKIRRLEQGLETAEGQERALQRELEESEEAVDVSDLEGKLAATQDKIFQIQAREAEVFRQLKILANDESLSDIPAAIDVIEREFTRLRRRAADALAARQAADSERERLAHATGEIMSARQAPLMDPHLLGIFMQAGDMVDDAMR